MSDLNMIAHGRGMETLRREMGWKRAQYVRRGQMVDEEIEVESFAFAERQVERVKPYLSDDDPDVRRAALFALKHFLWVVDGAGPVPIIDVYGIDGD